MSSDLTKKVEEALAEIRPALQADGGDIELDRVEDNVAYVRLLGACHGCAMATQTMAQGVEKVVKQNVPEITAVRQVDEAPAAASGAPAGDAPAPAEPAAAASGEPAAKSPFENQAPIAGIKTIVAVASGKGGVGKTTVAINLALAFQQQGLKVGILDADIYGPNVPVMLGVEKGPDVKGQRVLPARVHDLGVMSIAFFVREKDAVIWRGPMVMRAVQQFLRDVEWGQLDVLVVDLPPGTGDAQLTLAQEVPLDGAVIVTTPSWVALEDVRRGLNLFEAVKVPVFGVVENMAFFQCPHCSRETPVFNQGSTQKVADKLKIPHLAQIPLEPALREAGDEGKPMLVAEPTGPMAERFHELAKKLTDKLKDKLENNQ
jgi:ATP-binding protein involved in chromosome partitioning